MKKLLELKGLSRNQKGILCIISAAFFFSLMTVFVRLAGVAYTYAPAKDISVYDYTQVIFAAIWGFFLFDQIPDVLSVLGYIVIIGAAIMKFQNGRTKT